MHSIIANIKNTPHHIEPHHIRSYHVTSQNITPFVGEALQARKQATVQKLTTLKEDGGDLDGGLHKDSVPIKLIYFEFNVTTVASLLL